MSALVLSAGSFDLTAAPDSLLILWKLSLLGVLTSPLEFSGATAEEAFSLARLFSYMELTMLFRVLLGSEPFGMASPSITGCKLPAAAGNGSPASVKVTGRPGVTLVSEYEE